MAMYQKKQPLKKQERDLLDESDLRLSRMSKEELLCFAQKVQRVATALLRDRSELQAGSDWFEGVAQENKHLLAFAESVLEEHRLFGSSIERIKDGEVTSLEHLIFEKWPDHAGGGDE